jgi:hypothetical protein
MLKPMALAEVRNQTGVDMTYEQATEIVSPVNQRSVKQQAVALSQLTWRNTPDHWLRLQAALVILSHKA